MHKCGQVHGDKTVFSKYISSSNHLLRFELCWSPGRPDYVDAANKYPIENTLSTDSLTEAYCEDGIACRVLFLTSSYCDLSSR
jgi:hypothetical protein